MKLFLRHFFFVTFILSAPPAMADKADAQMELHTRAFQNKMVLPTLYTCDNKNLSPDLTWTNTPADTVSFAVVLSDLDAPNGTFYHWILYNIPTSMNGLSEGCPVPKGATIGKNNFDKDNYSGPCPPKGSMHHYVFTLYALNSKLNISPNAAPQEMMNAIRDHIISQAELTVTYSRWVQ